MQLTSLICFVTLIQLKDDAHPRGFEELIDEALVNKYKKDDYDKNGMNLFHYCIWKDHYSAVKKLAEHNYGIKLHQVNYLAKINVAG